MASSSDGHLDSGDLILASIPIPHVFLNLGDMVLRSFVWMIKNL